MNDTDYSLLTATGAHANGNVRYITITDNIPENWEDLIKIAKSSYTYFWYIYHDQDTYSIEEAEKHNTAFSDPVVSSIPLSTRSRERLFVSAGDLKPRHLHLVCYDSNGTSLKAHCSRFSSVIPCNMVCKVKTYRAMLRYLIHKDQPDKFQYDKSAVVSNCESLFLHSIGDSKVTTDKFSDICKIRRKEMSVQEFIEKYEFEISKLNIYQQVSLADKLYRFN